MIKNSIQTSGFSLAKQQELTGDDFYEVKVYDDLVIAIVCDGVGSAEYGAEAAKRVTKHLMNNFKNRPISWSIEKSIKTFIESINSILYSESIQNYERVELVTTLALVIIDGDRMYGANVGDSRIYLFRDNKLTQLSNDHAMDEAGYENVLTNAIGIEDRVDIYYFENNIQKEDKILLCSDGLYNVMSPYTLGKYLVMGAYSLVKKASKLMDDKLHDDTTAVVLEINEIDEVSMLKKKELPIHPALKAGDTVDGYLLEKSLIQNNRTWLCSKKGIKYVIKFAPLEAIENQQILDLYVKEVWNAKRLKAGFFPKAVLPKNRSSRYYVMSNIDGITLKEYLKKRVLSTEEAINLAKTLLHMLQYLLKFDLVHGDIKPENIMIIKRDEKKVFKVIDFGSITEIYSLSNRAGTPSYLAPERFKQSAINEKSEIFAVGVTLYESLTKSFPYGEIEPFQNPNFKSPTSIKKYNKNIPPWLESILLRAISVDGNLRYDNYSEMIYELENSDKVKPFFDKNTPILKRNPLKFYKIGFYLMVVLNFYLLINCLIKF